MEKVNARRGFLKGFGLGAAVIGGFASAGAANAVSVVGSSALVNRNQSERVNPDVVEDISHLAPKDNATSLVITGDNRPPPPPAPISVSSSPYIISSNPNSGGLFVSNYYQNCPARVLTCKEEFRNKVSMAVGKDDRLWIRVGDSWKRVALEN